MRIAISTTGDRTPDHRLNTDQFQRTSVLKLVPEPQESGQRKVSNPKERRRYPRIKKRVPIRHRLLSKISTTDFDNLERKVAHCYTRDFSHRGICIKTGEKISPGTVLELVIEFPEQPIKVVAKIVWSKDIENPGEFYSGMDYIAVADDQLNLMTQIVAESLIEANQEGEKTGMVKLKQTLIHLLSKIM
ncbi:PilZ domain-containing protein [Thermodesulfobacteriota bacterium]